MSLNITDEQTRQCVFYVTAFTNGHRKLLNREPIPDSLKSALLEVSRKHRVTVFGYIIMPSHVHLLLGLDAAMQLRDFMQEFLHTSAKLAVADQQHFWRSTYEAVLITSEEDFFRKLHDIHSNPVRRDLCTAATDFPHSSAAAWLHRANDGITSTEIGMTRIAGRRQTQGGGRHD